MKNSCYECKNRKVGCHINCLIYKKFKKEIAEKKKNKYDEYDNYVMAKITKENDFRLKVGKKPIVKHRLINNT